MQVNKKLYIVPALLIGLVALLVIRSEFGSKSISSSIQIQSIQEDGRRFDDRDREVPAFRVMSDVDTTEIDNKIVAYYQDILEWTPAYYGLTDQEFGERLREMCDYYEDICDKIKLEADFSLKEAYNFTVFTIHIVTSIDNNTVLEWIWSLRSTLASMRFTKDSVDIVRGKAWHRNVLINTYDMRDVVELLEIITHELGHIMGLWVIQDDANPNKNTDYLEFGEPAFGANDWSLKFYSISRETNEVRRNSSTNSNMISGYGHTNTYEEFAEFFNAWINHHTPLLELAKTDNSIRKKYFLFRELFGKRYLNADVETYRDLDSSTRPYDTTRRHDAAIHVH